MFPYAYPMIGYPMMGQPSSLGQQRVMNSAAQEYNSWGNVKNQLAVNMAAMSMGGDDDNPIGTAIVTWLALTVGEKVAKWYGKRVENFTEKHPWFADFKYSHPIMANVLAWTPGVGLMLGAGGATALLARRVMQTKAVQSLARSRAGQIAGAVFVIGGLIGTSFLGIWGKKAIQDKGQSAKEYRNLKKEFKGELTPQQMNQLVQARRNQEYLSQRDLQQAEQRRRDLDPFYGTSVDPELQKRILSRLGESNRPVQAFGDIALATPMGGAQQSVGALMGHAASLASPNMQPAVRFSGHKTIKDNYEYDLGDGNSPSIIKVKGPVDSALLPGQRFTFYVNSDGKDTIIRAEKVNTEPREAIVFKNGKRIPLEEALPAHMRSDRLPASLQRQDAYPEILDYDDFVQKHSIRAPKIEAPGWPRDIREHGRQLSYGVDIERENDIHTLKLTQPDAFYYGHSPGRLYYTELNSFEDEGKRHISATVMTPDYEFHQFENGLGVKVRGKEPQYVNYEAFLADHPKASRIIATGWDDSAGPNS